MIPNVYYDFSGVYNWPYPQLTGIQRVECGIYKGLKQSNIQLIPVFYDINLKELYKIEESSLPKTVTDFLEIPIHRPQPLAPPKENKIKELLKKVSFFRKIADWYYSSFIYFKFKKRITPPSLPAQIKKGDFLISASGSFTIIGHAEFLSQLYQEGVQVIRVIYDLIPALKPHWVTGNIAQRFTEVSKEQLCFSSLVLTISNFSKSEIHRFSNIHQLTPTQVEVIKLADNLKSNQLPNQKDDQLFFLCVCTFDVRKNHKLLYDAWQLLVKKYEGQVPKLILVGMEYLLSKDLIHVMKNDPSIKDHIEMKNKISDQELVNYYQNCIATIYPSFYEGWGLPVAESLGYGKICLSSDASSMQEIAPDLTEFFDPYNVYELMALVEKCWQETEWRVKREAEIKEKFQPTTWKDTARQVIPHLLKSNSNG